MTCIDEARVIGSVPKDGLGVETCAQAWLGASDILSICVGRQSMK